VTIKKEKGSKGRKGGEGAGPVFWVGEKKVKMNRRPAQWMSTGTKKRKKRQALQGRMDGALLESWIFEIISKGKAKEGGTGGKQKNLRFQSGA